MGIYLVRCNECATDELRELLQERGYALDGEIRIDKAPDEALYSLLKASAKTVILAGNTKLFVDFLNQKFSIENTQKIFTLDGINYCILTECKKEIALDAVIPVLNADSKTYYTTAKFKTFGLNITQLKALAGDFMRNRNKIVISFRQCDDGVVTGVRYSSKTSKIVVEQMLKNINAAFGENVYAYDDVPLSECVFSLLKNSGERLCLAESFTGGGIASAISCISGASSHFLESLVCYSNESKCARLGINEGLIRRLGAVSEDVAYEMAAALFLNPQCTIAAATTGYAGPFCPRAEDLGLCYIAAGTREGIYIFKHNFEGSREEITRQGINYALWHILQLLRKKQLQAQMQAQTAE